MSAHRASSALSRTLFFAQRRLTTVLTILTTEETELLSVWFFALKLSTWLFDFEEDSDLLLLSEGLVNK